MKTTEYWEFILHSSKTFKLILYSNTTFNTNRINLAVMASVGSNLEQFLRND